MTMRDRAYAGRATASGAATRPTPVLKEARASSSATLRAGSSRFDLPLAGRGTDFQKSVWKMMREIPYGETATYGGMAMALGSGPRAVGMACGRNPIPIIVPCHRVLGSGGKEGGFSGGQGLPTKRKLLAIEGVVLLYVRSDALRLDDGARGYERTYARADHPAGTRGDGAGHRR